MVSHLIQKHSLHFLQLGSIFRMGGKIDLFGFGFGTGQGPYLWIMMFLHEFVWVVLQVKELGVLDPGLLHLVLGQFPVPFPHTP